MDHWHKHCIREHGMRALIKAYFEYTVQIMLSLLDESTLQVLGFHKITLSDNGIHFVSLLYDCDTVYSCGHLSTVTVAEANVPVRSVSDDHLLSHSVRDDAAAASARMASDDIRNLTKSDDIDVNQCKHEVPENCIPSCWTFDDVSQRLRLDSADTAEMIDRCLLPMMKSKSSEQCCQRHDVQLSSAASSAW